MKNKEISAYNLSHDKDENAVCELLMQEINSKLSEAESKIWHGSPVWFLNDNPIVGYSVLKRGVQLLFWSGQSFDEEALSPVGKHKAAEIIYTKAEQIDREDLKSWLSKSKKIQWDYKNIVKNKGKLELLK